MEEFGYLEINSGRVLAELLNIPPVPETPRTDFQAAAWDFINRPDGPLQLAKAIWARVEERRFPRLLIDGIRQRATLDAVLGLSGRRRIGVLFVHTPPDVAFEFYRERGNGVSTIHDFLAIRDNPVEREVREMIGLSDVVLYNWTGRLSYRNIIGKLMADAEKTS